MINKKVSYSSKKLIHFCKKWNVVEFALFGSILREDFNPESDVDVLVTFSQEYQPGLFDLAQMQLELLDQFGRPVDLVEKRSLKNPFRKNAIIENSEVIYATSG